MTPIRNIVAKNNLEYREHRLVAPGMLFGKMRSNFIRKFFQRQLRMDTTKLADGKTLAILLQKIKLCERQ